MFDCYEYSNYYWVGVLEHVSHSLSLSSYSKSSQRSTSRSLKSSSLSLLQLHDIINKVNSKCLIFQLRLCTLFSFAACCLIYDVSMLMTSRFVLLPCQFCVLVSYSFFCAALLHSFNNMRWLCWQRVRRVYISLAESGRSTKNE